MVNGNDNWHNPIKGMKWQSDRRKRKPLDLLVTEKEVERILEEYDADIASELLAMKEEIEWLKKEVRRLKDEYGIPEDCEKCSAKDICRHPERHCPFLED